MTRTLNISYNRSCHFIAIYIKSGKFDIRFTIKENVLHFYNQRNVFINQYLVFDRVMSTSKNTF